MPLAIVADVDTASPQLLHVHADHLDRPIMLTNGSKANVWEAVYRPFGEVHAITGTATQNLRRGWKAAEPAGMAPRVSAFDTAPKVRN